MIPLPANVVVIFLPVLVLAWTNGANVLVSMRLPWARRLWHTRGDGGG